MSKTWPVGRDSPPSALEALLVPYCPLNTNPVHSFNKNKIHKVEMRDFVIRPKDQE